MTNSNKRATLPALQRAMRNDLTLDEKDNGAAAVTLARLFRTMKVGETDDADLPEWDFEEEGDPIVDSRLNMGMPVKRLTEVDKADFRVVWYGDRLQAEVFAKGKWRPLLERWSLRPANDNAERESPKPKMLVTRRQLSPLDAEDRDMFEALVGEDDLAEMALISSGATMREIGAAAGFSGKQAEAVGLDRTRRAVKVAQRAFGTLARMNADVRWWSSLANDDLVPADLVKRRLAA